MIRLKELIDKKRKALNNKTRMDFCLEIAIYHTENNEFNKAYEEYKELLELAEEDNNLLMKAKAFRQLGECMLELLKPLEALNHIQNYLNTSIELKDHFEIQRAYVTLGRCYLDYSLSLRRKKLKISAALKSESFFLKSLQLCQSLANGSSSNYSKSTSHNSKSNLTNEFAEMRAVSLFNLGLVNREKPQSRSSSSNAAENYFSQCSSICSKHKLWDLFLQSIHQRLDVKYFQSLENQPEFNINRKTIEDGLKMMRNSFNQMVDVPFSSAMKKKKKEIQELEAQCLVASGKLLKAAKKYRNFMKASRANQTVYENQMLCAMSLNKKLSCYHENKVNIQDEILIGKLYEELNVLHLAAKHFKLAMKKIQSKDSDDFLKLCNKLIFVNQIINNYQENVQLLQMKVKLFVGKTNDSATAAACCRVIEQLLDSWLRSGAVESQINDIIEVIQQLDSVAMAANSHLTQVSATKTIISVCEELENPILEKELIKSRIKLERLEALRNCSQEISEYETDDQNLSDLELSDTEIGILSSDSDVDLISLTEGQIEELEAVGKRTKSDPNKSFIKRNEKGETLLHVAAINGNLKQVEKLVDKLNHPLDIVDSAGWTALHDAANHGHIKIVKFLLDRGAKLEHTGPSIDYSTPLMEAVHGGNIDIAIMLIERGANLWHKNREAKNLGDCLDEWKIRCQMNNSYDEPEARAYQTIMVLIKKKLGEKYVTWCRQRKGCAPIQSTTVSAPRSSEVVMHDRRQLKYDESSQSDQDTKDPVLDYVTTIRSVQRCKKKVSQETNNLKTNQEAGYVIGDDWLENDIVESKSRKRKVQEPDYGGFVRSSSKRKSLKEEYIISHKSLMKKKYVQLKIDNQSDDLFDEYNETDIVSSTQLSSQNEIEPNSSNNPVVNSVTVTYRSISMIIPLMTRCTVKWVSEEIARRYSFLGPGDLVHENDVDIRIASEDGSLLLETDCILDVISNLGPGPVKLIATDSSITAKAVSSIISSRFQQLHNSIQTGLDNHILDLSNRQLGQDLQEYFIFLHCTLNLKSLSKLLLKGNLITDGFINKSYVTSSCETSYNFSQTIDFTKIIQYHSSVLTDLDLSNNQISGTGLSNLLQSLNDRIKLIPLLKVLNLSSNPIGSNGFCVLSLIIKPILSVFPSLQKLIMAQCEISTLFEYSSIRGNQEKPELALCELDLSNNPLVLKRENLSSNFWKLVVPCLKNLSFQGCGQILDKLYIDRSVVTEFVISVVELVSMPLLKLKQINLSDCSLDMECIHHLGRLFTNKQSPLSFMICNSNNFLKDSTENWCTLVHGLNHPLCRITKLSIDMPFVTNFADYQICIYTVKEKIQAKIGFKLSALYLKIDFQMINHIKHALFECGSKHLDNELIRLQEEDKVENETQTNIHYGRCFVLSVIDAFRNRDGNDNVRTEFEDNILKIMSCIE